MPKKPISTGRKIFGMIVLFGLIFGGGPIVWERYYAYKDNQRFNEFLQETLAGQRFEIPPDFKYGHTQDIANERANLERLIEANRVRQLITSPHLGRFVAALVLPNPWDITIDGKIYPGYDPGTSQQIEAEAKALREVVLARALNPADPRITLAPAGSDYLLVALDDEKRSIRLKVKKTNFTELLAASSNTTP